MILGLHPSASENPQVCAALLSDLAGRGFDFRQLHLNIIEGSGRAALLAENTAERLAWCGVANPHKRHNVCGHFSDEDQNEMGWTAVSPNFFWPIRNNPLN